MAQAFNWWRDGIIYQIYPRSFSDTNQDGFGDLPGIIQKLDYLASLGIDAIWLSPIYPSPDADFGYDVSDHCAVDPRYGTLSDFDRLVAEAHRRGIRVVLDMVLNHTSNQHPWFIESRSGRENPKRDWYIWRDPSSGGRPPSNWKSMFGGSAWQFDALTGQYYLHTFLKEQPDVNWRNPDVRQAQLDVFRFWLERGVDGFRLDVFNAYFKDAGFRDNPACFGLRGFDRQQHIHDINQPEMTGLLQELRVLLDAYPERYAVGESFVTSPAQTVGYTGEDRLHAVFSFDLFGSELSFPWNPAWLLRQISRRDTLFEVRGDWPTTVLSNHDQPRTASRYERGEKDGQVFIAMALLLTIRGTPFMYYGEELGMRDISLKRSEIRDPAGKRYWPVYRGRDGCRSPMQWSNDANAGFSASRPWLKVHPDYLQRNTATQSADPSSVLNFTRRLIALRRDHPALRQGTFKSIFRSNTRVLAYERELDGERILIYLNFANKINRTCLPAGAGLELELLLDTAGRDDFILSNPEFSLYPHEVLLLAVKPVAP